MTKQDIATLVARQRKFFLSGATLNHDFRLEHLKKFRTALVKHEDEIMHAVRQDVGRPEVETFFMETNNAIDELDNIIKHFRDWVDPTRVRTPMLFPLASVMSTPNPMA